MPVALLSDIVIISNIMIITLMIYRDMKFLLSPIPNWKLALANIKRLDMTCISFYMRVHTNVMMLNSIFVHTIHMCTGVCTHTCSYMSATHMPNLICVHFGMHVNCKPRIAV